jgi:hypothetical protein
MRPRLLRAGIVIVLAAAGCERQGTLPGQAPSPLSTYEPPAVLEPQVGVLERQAAKVDPDTTPIAWTAVTLEDTSRVDEAHRLGRERRESSPEIRTAEAQACSGLAEVDRDASPFVHRADIVRIEPIERGARVRFRHVDGLDAAWLQHLVECHLARDEIIGANAPDTKECPLAVHGATVHVAADGKGYVVEVRSDNVSSAEEIARRARALHP